MLVAVNVAGRAAVGICGQSFFKLGDSGAPAVKLKCRPAPTLRFCAAKAWAVFLSQAGPLTMQDTALKRLRSANCKMPALMAADWP
jgi:hypothetical protein